MDLEQPGIVEGLGESDLVSVAAAFVETWDWMDHATNLAWLAMGKQQVWLDYGLLLELGCNGADLEEKLNRLGIQVYGKDILTQDGAVLAFVLVDGNRVVMVRNMLGKMGVLL